VVYGEPAIAVPLQDLRLSVVLASPEPVWPAGQGGEVATPSTGRGNTDSVQTLSMPAVGSVELSDLAETETLGDTGSMTLDLGEQPPLQVDVDDDAPEGAQADISRALGAAAQALGLPMPLPLRVAVRSGGLRSGMGTSAALGTALARGLLAWYGEPADERVRAAALAVEQLFHIRPSGIDHAVTVSESPVWYEKDSEPVVLQGLPPLDLVLLPRTSERKTADLVEEVRQRLVSDPSLVRVVAEMGRWSRDGRDAWKAGDMPGLAEAMRGQQRSLERLGVTCDSDRDGVQVATDAGALAAKVTGAGWGGTLLALVNSTCAEAVLEAWGSGALRVRIAP